MYIHPIQMQESLLKCSHKYSKKWTTVASPQPVTAFIHNPHHAWWFLNGISALQLSSRPLQLFSLVYRRLEHTSSHTSLSSTQPCSPPAEDGPTCRWRPCYRAYLEDFGEHWKATAASLFLTGIRTNKLSNRLQLESLERFIWMQTFQIPNFKVRNVFAIYAKCKPQAVIQKEAKAV